MAAGMTDEATPPPADSTVAEGHHDVGRRRRWRVAWRLVAVVAAALLLAGTAVCIRSYAAYRGSIPKDLRYGGVNAVWLAHRWVGEDSVDYDGLAEMLRVNEITDAYFHVGPISADGTIPQSRFPYAAQLVAELRRRLPELRIQAWMGQIEAALGGVLDLDDRAVRSRIVATAERFLDLGFDGIHYDIEPIFPGDERFIDLLAATRSRIDQRGSGLLSVATMELEPFRGAARLGRAVVRRYHAWTADYYEQVAGHVDQLAVMTYDAALPTDWLYGALVRRQTIQLARRLPDDVTLLIGIPSYAEGNLGHWPGAENVRSGVRGVRLGLAGLDPADRTQVGIAIYAGWTTDDEEWRTYRRDWLRS